LGRPLLLDDEELAKVRVTSEPNDIFTPLLFDAKIAEENDFRIKDEEKGSKFGETGNVVSVLALVVAATLRTSPVIIDFKIMIIISSRFVK